MESNDQWIGEELTPHDVWQHRVTNVLTSCQTPFQTLAVVDSGAYGRALVLDNRWQTCTGDEFLYHEPIVHTPLILHGNPRRVLIAGGADGGAAREALKWKSVEEIRMVDIDGAAVEACRTWLPEIHQGSLNHPRVQVEIGDAYDVIAQERNWDVIIADLTDPIEDGPAYKLFTREFFTLCRQALSPGGVFVNQAGSMSPPLLTPLARTAKTIESVFEHTAVMSIFVPTYGSPWGMVLASDQPINPFPSVEEIDKQIAQSINGTLRMFDGRTLLGLLQAPLHVRDRIASETTIYSLDNPPQLSRGNA